MGAWEQGIIMANAMDRRAENNAIAKRDNMIAEANVRLAKSEPMMNDFQSWLDLKKIVKHQGARFHIFSEERPDLAKKDPKYKDRYYKRVFNLKLIAWSEWWGQMLAGQREMNKQDSPKLRGLSQLIEKGAATTPAAAKALADIADR